jgi:Fe-S-cluster containining protein
MRDGLVRRLVKRVAAWRYGVDLACTRAWARWRGEAPRYELHGRCTGCGACCETPMIHVNRWVYHTRTLRALILWWHRVVNGFEYLGGDRQQHAFIFRCTHLDPVTKQCDSYDSRPGLCRDYPRNLLDDPNPQFLPACGHCAMATNADEIRASLRDLNLPADRLAALERQFHVAPAPLPHQPGPDQSHAQTRPPAAAD